MSALLVGPSSLLPVVDPESCCLHLWFSAFTTAVRTEKTIQGVTTGT